MLILTPEGTRGNMLVYFMLIWSQTVNDFLQDGPIENTSIATERTLSTCELIPRPDRNVKLRPLIIN